MERGTVRNESCNKNIVEQEWGHQLISNVEALIFNKESQSSFLGSYIVGGTNVYNKMSVLIVFSSSMAT